MLKEKMMENNKHSTEGALEDLIRSMVQMCCTELHEKTNLERLNADLELDRIELIEFDNKESELIESLKTITTIRREQLLLIYNLAGGAGDKTQWCKIKHLAMAMYTAFEAYQAIDDPALYESYLKINKVFIETLTKFMGMEVTQCASCFTDMIKAKEVTIDKEEFHGE